MWYPWLTSLVIGCFFFFFSFLESGSVASAGSYVLFAHVYKGGHTAVHVPRSHRGTGLRVEGTHIQYTNRTAIKPRNFQRQLPQQHLPSSAHVPHHHMHIICRCVLQSDVWSLGCILYELAVLRSPFKEPGLKLVTLFKKIKEVSSGLIVCSSVLSAVIICNCGL